MNTNFLSIKTSFIKNKNSLEEIELASGEIRSRVSANNFLFYLICLDNTTDSKIVKKIVQLLENNSKTIVGEITPEMFEKSLSMVNQTLDRLAQKGDGDWLGSLNAIIGIVNQEELYLSQTGKIIGYISRKNKISSLTANNEELTKPINTFSEITSGKLQLDDQVFFTTDNMFSRISLDRIRESLKLKDPGIIALNLRNTLRKAKINDVNALFFSVNNDKIENDQLSTNYFLDEPETNALSEIAKKIKPTLTVLLSRIEAFSKIAFAKIEHASKVGKENFEKNIAPKTKDFVKSNFDKLKEKEEFKNIKIRSNDYKNSKSSSVNQYLRSLSYLLSQSKRLLLKENRKYVYGTLLVIALVIGYGKITHNNSTKNNKAKEIEITNAYDKAVTQFTKAKEDLLLNKTSDLTSIYSALTLAEKSKENPNNVEKANVLIKSINEIIDDKTKTVRITDAVSYKFADNIKNILLVENSIYGLNQDGKIYSVDTRDKEAALIGSVAKDSNAQSMTFSQALNAILINSNSKVYTLDVDSKTIGETKLINTSWPSITTTATYSTNIYALDSTAGTILKYVKKDDGFSGGTKYADTTKVSLKNAVDFAVDGNFYVLKGDGTVAKFAKGSYDQDFTIKEIPAPHNSIGEGTKIITSEDTTNIFILDKKNNRIVKFDKSGSFLNQYVFDNTTIDNFVINAKLQKLWILSSGKIYEGNL